MTAPPYKSNVIVNEVRQSYSDVTVAITRLPRQKAARNDGDEKRPKLGYGADKVALILL